MHESKCKVEKGQVKRESFTRGSANVALLRPAAAGLRRAPETGDFGLGKANRAGLG